MQNNAYWKGRFAELEQVTNQTGVAFYQSVEDQYYQAQRTIENQINTWYQRFAVNNQISMSEARKLLTAKELSEFKWDVKEYIKYGELNAIDGAWMKQLENASARYHISRLETLKYQTQQSMEVLFGNQIDGFDTLAKQIYSNGYYHSIYEIHKGVGVGQNIAAIDENRLKKIISKPWAADGRNFSDRIWKDKTRLTNELHTQLTQNCILGKGPDEAIKNLAKSMKTSNYNARRLIMTESAFFASAAQKDAYIELGIEQFEIVATLDSKTSAICQELDGKVFDTKDYEPGVTANPFHPSCRSTTAPYFDDEWNVGERAARGEDGKTYYVPDSMKYRDWKETFVDGGAKDGLKVVGKNDIIKNIGDTKDWDSLVQYMNNKYNISIDDVVKTLNFEVVKRSLFGVESVFDEFPEVAANIGNINASKSGVMSCTGEKITFNPSYFLDDQKLPKICFEMDDIHHWVNNVSPESIGVHEAAHGLEWVLINANTKYGYNWEKVTAWNKCSEAKEIVSQACKNVKKTVYGKGKVNSELIESISHYAIDSASETMAEAFADVYANGNNANQLSIEIKKLTIEKLNLYKKGG